MDPSVQRSLQTEGWVGGGALRESGWKAFHQASLSPHSHLKTAFHANVGRRCDLRQRLFLLLKWEKAQLGRSWRVPSGLHKTGTRNLALSFVSFTGKQVIHSLCKPVWGRNIYLLCLQIQKSLLYVTTWITPASPSIHLSIRPSEGRIWHSSLSFYLHHFADCFLNETHNPVSGTNTSLSRPLSPLLRSTRTAKDYMGQDSKRTVFV